MNFPVCEMTLLHFLAEIKEIAVGDATSSIIFERLDVVGKMTLLADIKIS
jgi:hypothetical protein